jgi:hypothetical protein
MEASRERHDPARSPSLPGDIVTAAEVDAWFDDLDHPMKDAALTLRHGLATVSPDVVENIKWKAPNFAVRDDFATMNLRRLTAIQVILHTGARPKPEHPEILLDDPSSLLRRADRNRWVATFTSADHVRDALPAFLVIATSWAHQLE